jgi:hypothetical protein
MRTALDKRRPADSLCLSFSLIGVAFLVLNGVLRQLIQFLDGKAMY